MNLKKKKKTFYKYLELLLLNVQHMLLAQNEENQNAGIQILRDFLNK